MSISKDTIEFIRARAQIEEIIKRYVPSMKKRGANYIALCPFHKEKTPSFTISPEKQIFHCFGCHVGGNVFTFISKIEKLNFPESVRLVGDIVGIRVKEDDRRDKTDRFVKYIELNQIANNKYHKFLKSESGRLGLKYLQNRGLSEDSISLFKLGYSPNSWNYLTNHFHDLGIPLSLSTEIGLIGMSDKNGKKRYYDKFRNRIIFPIHNHKNEIIAFGGRTIGEDGPKYLNSSESIIFNKRNVLYGLNVAKEYISEFQRSIVVEGYLDVIGCHQRGVKNVVAPMGTALTTDQVGILTRFCKEIILLFDADSAGINASLRSIDILKNISVDVKVAVLPEGDPFDFINKNGIKEFMAIIDSSLSPIDFKITRVISDSGSKDKLKVLLNIFNILKEINYETEKSFYLKKVSSLIGIEENIVRADFKKFLLKGNKIETFKANVVHSINEKTTFLIINLREMVIFLCNYPEFLQQAVIDFSENDFTDKISKNIFNKLCEFYSRGEEITISKMFDFFIDGEEKELLEESLFNEYSIENPEDVYTEIYINLKLCYIDKKIDQYAQLIKKHSSNNKSDDLAEYLTEVEVLRREKEKLSSYLYNKNII